MILKQSFGTLVFLLSFLCLNISQAQTPYDMICAFNPNEFATPNGGGLCSHNGLSHTPDGTLRLLVVFAGFEGFQGESVDGNPTTQPGISNWDNDISNEYQLPSFVQYNPNTEEVTMDEFMFTDETILQPGTIHPSTNLSNILYLMSQPNRAFNVVGSVFTDPSGRPRQVVIPTNDLDNWDEANRKVAERMVEIWETETDNPNPEQAVQDYFSQFDQRENSPSYVFNNVNTFPDGIIDFVVYIYRYRNTWDPQPINGMNGWNGSGGGLYSNGIISPTTPIGGFGFQNGYLGALGGKDQRYLFLHEFGHAIFNAPHNCGANGVAGDHFPVGHTGTGAASTNVPIFNPLLAAWERWHLGFTNPFEPTDTDGSYTYVINDYITTGDAIRVPIPFPEEVDPNTGAVIDRQYLWIENHNKIHPLDENIHAGKNLNLSGNNDSEHIVTDNDAGIYMYVEDMTEGCEDTGVFGRGGSMQMINPMGNWDLFHNVNIPTTQNAWEAVMHPFEYTIENPISGSNPWFKHREDLDDVNTEIGYNGNHNNPGPDNESTVIYREKLDDGLFHHTYRAYGVRGGTNNSTAFLSADVLSMGTNPTVINYPKYNSATEEVDPYFLNGLKIEILSSGNPATIKVSYKQTAIEENVRWTGDIVLPDITENSDPDLVLAENKQIMLDLSGTPHRESENPITNRHTNPTSLTISSGSKIHLLDNSRILIKEHATLLIEDGAEVLLEDKACIVVEPGGTLHYKGEDITLNGPDAVIILKGTLKTDDDVDFTFKGTGYADIHSTHTLDMGVGSNFNLNRLNLPGQGTRFLRIRENTNLSIQDRFLDLKGGKVLYDANSKITASNADVRFVASTFEPSGPLSGTDLPVALEATNLLSLDIRKSTFEDLRIGVKVSGVTSNPIMLTNNFTHCEKGLELSEIDEITISQHTFSEQSDFSVKLISVDEVTFVQTDILHTQKIGVGLDLHAVNFAYITLDSHIDDCDIGIKSETSNVFLNNGTTISNNNEGVKFVNNPTAEYLLSVGRCRCANVIDNNIGVVGDNIVLDIDAPTHFWDCNTLEEHGNKFDGNITIFDICYTDPAFNTFNSILARGNFWGGQSVNNYPYTIHDCVADITISIDDSDFVANVNDLPSCFSSDPSPPTDPQYPSHQLAKIGCKKVLGGVQVEVHTQAKSAHKDLYEKEYPIAETKFQPVSNIDITNDNNDKCVNIVNISRCITRALENDRYAALNSYWLDEATRSLPKYQDQITVFPNPTSGAFTIDSKNEEEYFVKIISATGNTVYSSKFINMLIVDKKDFKKGIYFLEFQQNETGNISVQKLLIQ